MGSHDLNLDLWDPLYILGLGTVEARNLIKFGKQTDRKGH